MLMLRLVPTPRKIKERRKMAVSRMATNLTQKPILSRFIIMAVYPPGSSDARTIVYHVSPDDRGHDPTACSGLEHVPLRIPVPRHDLDQRQVGPFACLYGPRLSLDAERPRPPERGQLEADRTF